MDKLMEDFKNNLLETLGQKNIVLIYHHGSRARGEARKDSDYDTILILKKINEKTLKQIRNVLARHSGFQTYLLSEKDFQNLPSSQKLQFFNGEKLYGEINVKKPTKKEILGEIQRCKLDCLHYLRHYITLPHDHEKKVKVIFFLHKDSYFFMNRLAYYVTGKIINSRKELISIIDLLPVNSTLAKEILRTLEFYNDNKLKIAEKPDEYLFKLERFFRTTDI